MSKFTGTLFMPQRYQSLSYLLHKVFLRNLLLILFVFASSVQLAQTTDELQKQAEKLFKEENYDDAYKYYSQLVSNFPKDPEYNYRLGVCMIYSEADKSKCLPFLKLAAANPNDAPKEVLFYLGKAYHINYRFDEAVRNYNEFKKTASSSLQKKLQVDREITACINGKKLLSNFNDLTILSKKELPKVDYFRSYDLKKMGKLLAKPDEFKTSIDKKKKENSIVFLPSQSDIVYFSSYGDDPATGKDIYTARRISGGFSKPEKVKNINTEYDEDFPFLHPDGKTLYFASKGFNSMGGYDIFKSTYNESSNTWNAPINLEFPVNSPDDDFLYITDSLETVAYFSTGRQSSPGKIDVLKVKTKRRPMDVLAVKGSVKAGQVDHSLASTITVKLARGNQELGKYSATEDGAYTMEVPTGEKLLYTVETPGMQTQTSPVTIPTSESIRPIKQTITYEGGKLKIESELMADASEESYLDNLNLIEKKARLDVNESTDKGENEAPLAAETKGTTPSSQASGGSSSMSNKELAAMARKDAEESRTEAAQLSVDYKNATDTSKQLTLESNRKKTEAEKIRNGAESLTSDAERELKLHIADSLTAASEADAVLAAQIQVLGASLDEDARRKDKEANLNEQYSKELEKAVNSKDPIALQKLSDLQTQIEALSKQENASTGLLEALKSELTEKEKTLSNLETANSELSSSIIEIDGLTKTKQTELDAAKKKKIKEQLGEEIKNLNLEKSEKENEIVSNKEKMLQISNDIAKDKSELEIAASLRDPSKLPVAKASVSEMNAKQLRDFYGSKIAVSDNGDKNNIENSINSLNAYNLDLDAAIARNKNLLGGKTAQQKQEITAEIKSLESDRKLNQTRLSANFNRITELNKVEAKNKIALETSTTYRPIKADNPLEAMSLINELSGDLKESEIELFSIPYKDANARTLRDEANNSLQTSLEKQQQILADIDVAKENLQKVDTSNVAVTVVADSLYAAADAYTEKAQELRTKSQKAKESEKQSLLTESKKLDEKALDLNLKASELVSKDNTLIIAANLENIQNLTKLGKASSTDASTAKRLNDEAVLAFRKAVDIRTEAKSIANKGSKLGSYSNAEDLEAEAIQKQQEAIAMLMRTAEDFKLKVAVTSTTLAKNQNDKPKGMSLDQALATVNTNVVELGKLKLESYRKLYDANAAEIDGLKTEIASKQELINQTPVLKTEQLNCEKVLSFAVDYKTSSDAASEPNDQFNYLITAIRQQNLTQQKFADLKFSLEKAEQQAKSPKVETQVVESPPIADQTDVEITSPEPTTQKQELDVIELTNSTVETSSPVIENAEDGLKKELGETASPEPTVLGNNNIIEINEIANTESSSEQIIAQLNQNGVKLRNEEAGELVQKSLGRLTELDQEMNSASAALNQNETNRKLAQQANGDPISMRKEADALLLASEDLADEAQDARTEAAKAKGTAKQALQSEAVELEKQSQEKLFQSARMMQNANENEYRSNALAIKELLKLLDQDDASKASTLRETERTFEPQWNKAKLLRTEAERLANPAAKLGSIGNAEEKEAEVLGNQTKLLTQLKQSYPDYIVKPSAVEAVEIDTLAEEKRKTIVEEQYTQMINLTNGYSLEYESDKLAIPQELNEQDQQLKKNADDLNAESKRLLIASALEPDYGRRMRLLALAAKYGNTAIEQLAKIGKSKEEIASIKKTSDKPDISQVELIDANAGDKTIPVVTGGNIKEDLNPAKEKTVKPINTNTNKASSNLGGIQILKGNAYSNANPIPIDAKMEGGLVFRVQIGAFKVQIPNNSFKGLSPLNGETTRNGYIRYTAGNFQKVEGATAVKNDLRKLGYNDAFVVVYYNGKRVTMAEALNVMKEKGIEIDPNAPQSASITANSNVPRANNGAAVQDIVTISKPLEKTKGLLYTIQIGVFNRQVSKVQLRNLQPIFAEELGSGLFRYTAGMYNNAEKVIADKNRVVDLGLKDAFVSAYIDGKRIQFADARTKQESDPSILTESENAIVFPGASAPVYVTATAPVSGSTVVPYTNGVTVYPEATIENGIKNDEIGVSFKVQLGAFNGEVPEDLVEKFNEIKTWPVDHKIVNGMFVYTVGNFSAVNFARILRDEIKDLGLEDVYITVYRDGKKLGGQEAEDLLR